MSHESRGVRARKGGCTFERHTSSVRYVEPFGTPSGRFRINACHRSQENHGTGCSFVRVPKIRASDTCPNQVALVEGSRQPDMEPCTTRNSLGTRSISSSCQKHMKRSRRNHEYPAGQTGRTRTCSSKNSRRAAFRGGGHEVEPRADSSARLPTKKICIHFADRHPRERLHPDEGSERSPAGGSDWKGFEHSPQRRGVRRPSSRALQTPSAASAIVAASMPRDNGHFRGRCFVLPGS